MEEWIGLQWHRLASRMAEPRRPHLEARLAEVQPTAALLLHAGGARQRIATAAPVRVGGERRLWQKVSGLGTRLPLAQLDAQVLALPERIDVFDDLRLNRDLYLWWAALASCIDLALPWAPANVQASVQALERFPGLRERWRRLQAADRAARCRGPHPAEATLQGLLQRLADEGPYDLVLREAHDAAALAPDDVAPVWCWLVPAPQAPGSGADPGADTSPDGAHLRPAPALPTRRRARQGDPRQDRAPLLLAAKGESLRLFADPMALQRGHDDDDDDSARVAAEDLQTLSLQRSEGGLAARVRFDLDLPSASADDLPVGPGRWLPEWDVRLHALQPRRVLAQHYVARDATPWQPSPALQATARRVRRRLEGQRVAPRWLQRAADGDAIDLDAWVRAQTRPGDTVEADAVYQRLVRCRREMATLLLADLSLSTDAYVDDRQRVIDVVREALYVFGEALAGCGDPFEVLGFSSVRRRLRLHEIKGFDERWSAALWPRLGALKPGYYTRMGAALRAATVRLAPRPERQRLLLLLTDGKPHDLDGYEGRRGVEDTRQAVLEARRAGLLPFALSIDAQASEVMPALFGHQGWAWVRRPAELVQQLAMLYARLRH